jgi:hypothetical protein
MDRFGFRCVRGGAHTARTMMLEDMQLLMAYINGEDARREDYIQAIQQDNCLAKRSGKTRKLSTRHLMSLYSLDPAITLFRALRYLWKRDPQGQPLLALVSAFARDNLLRMSAPFVLQIPQGSPVLREDLEAFIDNLEPGRFSRATLKSVAQNLNSTWTKAGHIRGRVKKIRSQAQPTPGSVSYALLLGYLKGSRGPALFETEYAKLLDCRPERAIELAQDASRKGWIVVKRVGQIIEVLFPNLLTVEEKEWIRE